MAPARPGAGRARRRSRSRRPGANAAVPPSPASSARRPIMPRHPARDHGARCGEACARRPAGHMRAMPEIPAPTRAAALARLVAFAPRMGRDYAAGRNNDPGPGARRDVSLLSPAIRHRLVTEQEVVRAALDAHGAAGRRRNSSRRCSGAATGRAGWSCAPASGTPTARERDRALADAAAPALRPRDGAAGPASTASTPGRELVETGWLHNHARMWFASIWIFTLRLPWVLGADFIPAPSADADAASNTLSWRWVAGMQTRGKHYVARAENIARYTVGRFDPRGQLDENPAPLDGPAPPPCAAAAGGAPPAGALRAAAARGRPASRKPLRPARARRRGGGRRGAAGALAAGLRAGAAAFTEAALAGCAGARGRAIRRAGAAGGDRGDPCARRRAGRARRHHAPGAGRLDGDGAGTAAARRWPRAASRCMCVRRDWDSLCWPHATQGLLRLPRAHPGASAQRWSDRRRRLEAAVLRQVRRAPEIPGRDGAARRPGLADRGQARGFGCSSSPAATRQPSRTPKSSTGRTSARPRVKISSISTVQRPTPRIGTRRSTSASSDSAPRLRAGRHQAGGGLLGDVADGEHLVRRRSRSRASPPAARQHRLGRREARRRDSAMKRPRIASAARPCTCWWAMARTSAS